ncbi:MAG: DUF4190 domain-containing protein [Candidatus Woesearchaeota archaeon]
MIDKKNSKLAIASLIMSIITAVFMLFAIFNLMRSMGSRFYIDSVTIIIGIIFIVPIVLGIISLKNIKTDSSLKGKSMAKAGIIIGLIPLVLLILLTISAIKNPYVKMEDCSINGGFCVPQKCDFDSQKPILATGGCNAREVCCINISKN